MRMMMLGRAAYWKFGCSCCYPLAWHPQYKRNRKRREEREWKRDYRDNP